MDESLVESPPLPRPESAAEVSEESLDGEPELRTSLDSLVVDAGVGSSELDVSGFFVSGLFETELASEELEFLLTDGTDVGGGGGEGGRNGAVSSYLGPSGL